MNLGPTRLSLGFIIALALSPAGLLPADQAAAPIRHQGLPVFSGTVYQVDTISNTIDVIMPGGTRRFETDAATRVRVHGRPAALIDIAMGDAVRGAYKSIHGDRTAVTINDVTGK